MRKSILFSLTILLTPGPLAAFFNENQVGTTSGQILKLGAGARAAGLGEAHSAMAQDAIAIFWNPAGLGHSKARSATFMHAAWLESITYDVLGLTHPMGRNGALGLGLQYLSYGSFDSLDNTGGVAGKVSPREVVATLGWGRKVDSWALGFSGKFIHSKIDSSASTWALDVGTQKMGEMMGKAYALGLAIQNLGPKLKFHREGTSLPLVLRLGSTLSIRKHWLGALDLNLPSDNKPWVAVGTEYSIMLPNKGLRLAGRLGYNTRSMETKELNGISVGLGLGLNSFRINYAFMPFGILGNTHRISLNLRWGHQRHNSSRVSHTGKLPHDRIFSLESR